MVWNNTELIKCLPEFLIVLRILFSFTGPLYICTAFLIRVDAVSACCCERFNFATTTNYLDDFANNLFLCTVRIVQRMVCLCVFDHINFFKYRVNVFLFFNLLSCLLFENPHFLVTEIAMKYNNMFIWKLLNFAITPLMYAISKSR